MGANVKADVFTQLLKVDADTADVYSNALSVMHHFAQVIFLHAPCSCCDLRSMLTNRHPHPLRAAARRLCFSPYLLCSEYRYSGSAGYAAGGT